MRVVGGHSRLSPSAIGRGLFTLRRYLRLHLRYGASERFHVALRLAGAQGQGTTIGQFCRG